jgi:ACR3 family arsenite efflux pump ArsB
MTLLDKLQSLLILGAVLAGLALGQITWLEENASAFIVPFLMLMLVGVFLHVPIRDLAHGFRNVRFTSLNLAVNFIWTPVFGWGLGAMFLRDQPDLWVGLIMLLVTPCTDWYLVFTSVARGNVALASTQLPWHLVVQLLLLPVYLFLFAGALVPIQADILLESIAVVLIVPLMVAVAARWSSRRYLGRGWLESNLLPHVGSWQLGFLLLAIAAMFASQGRLLIDRLDLVLLLAPALLVFYVTNLVLALAVGRMARFDGPACVGLCFATLARNSPISLAIAVTAFPDRPLIALALVIGPLIELPVLAVLAQLLKRVSRQPAQATLSG